MGGEIRGTAKTEGPGAVRYWGQGAEKAEGVSAIKLAFFGLPSCCK